MLPWLTDGREMFHGWAYERDDFETPNYVAYKEWRRQSCTVETGHRLVHCMKIPQTHPSPNNDHISTMEVDGRVESSAPSFPIPDMKRFTRYVNQV